MSIPVSIDAAVQAAAAAVAVQSAQQDLAVTVAAGGQLTGVTPADDSRSAPAAGRPG